MIDTILFDLDGTLLPMDFDRFTKIYFNEIGLFLQDLMPPKQLIKSILTATDAMVNNTEPITNQEVFMNSFGELIDGNIDTYMERFDTFYDKGFLNTRESVFEVPIIKQSVQNLKKKNYQLVLATNPIFPQKAIHHRINWAGFDPSDFSHITSFEKSHYCKPNIQYFKEILEIIGKSPEQCLMVGNDVQEDCVASQLGMQTYLIKNHMIHRTDEAISSTYIGDYNDFYAFTEQMEITA